MALQVFHSPSSPYVRKVRLAAAEKGISDAIELLPAKAWPVARDKNIVKENPSGRVPTALTPDGLPLYDSRVIVAYIDTMSPDCPLIPADSNQRFRVMTLEALADGAMEASLLCRFEVALRPEELRWQLWLDSQMEKVDSSLDDLEARWMEMLNGPVNIGTIGVACFLSYLDFRFTDKDWRSNHPKLAKWFKEFSGRPSMRETALQ